MEFIAYKLEALVKDLEVMTNRYLAELNSGRFQLSFKINSSDKLNVVITDDGNDIEISALSNGELARVNNIYIISNKTISADYVGLKNQLTNSR